MSTISGKILEIIHESISFDEENPEVYYENTDKLHTKITALLYQKVAITTETAIKPNTPLWLWRKGSNKPELANYRTDYPSPLFWPIVDGDYINNSNAIPFEKATHFMYLNDPED